MRDFRVLFWKSPISTYRGAHQSRLIASKQEVLSNYQHQDYLIIDARSPQRFAGSEPEPRDGVRSGHIPNAKNLHYNRVFLDGKLRSTDDLTRLFAGIDPDWQYKRLVFTCGSGVTACILALAAAEAGATDWSVYDGSWTEWGGDPNCPVIVGD